VPDITAGRTEFGVMAFGSFQSPPMKLLAVLREKRHARYPDVPTSTELGFPAESAAFGGLYAPAATPKPVLEKIEAACQRAHKAPTVRKVFEDTGQATEFAGSAAFAARLAADSKNKADAIKLLHLKVD
jgi:tripartite-type tricarboxylate transporter receptor subunit TctC